MYRPRRSSARQCCVTSQHSLSGRFAEGLSRPEVGRVHGRPKWISGCAAANMPLMNGTIVRLRSSRSKTAAARRFDGTGAAAVVESRSKRPVDEILSGATASSSTAVERLLQQMGQRHNAVDRRTQCASRAVSSIFTIKSLTHWTIVDPDFGTASDTRTPGADNEAVRRRRTQIGRRTITRRPAELTCAPSG